MFIEADLECFSVSTTQSQPLHFMFRKHSSGSAICLLACFHAEWITSLMSALPVGNALSPHVTARTFAEAHK